MLTMPPLFLRVKILTPEKTEFEGQNSMVVLPGSEGEFGVLPRHDCFSTRLKAGIVQLFEGKKSCRSFRIERGFAHITPSECTILVSCATEV